MRAARTYDRSLRAFSLVELLIVIGVVTVAVGLFIPHVALLRERAKITRSLSNARECGRAVTLHAADRNDLPPSFFPPVFRRYQVDPIFEVMVRERRARGFWFSESHLWHYAMDPYLPGDVLRSPLVHRRSPVTVESVRTDQVADYHLSRSFYAPPSYFNPVTRIGPSQWSVQGFWKVRHPSSKGLLNDWFWYSASRIEGSIDPIVRSRQSSAVLWADHSASAEDLHALKRGIRDPWDPYNWWQPRNNPSGPAILNTLDGVYGVDR